MTRVVRKYRKSVLVMSGVLVAFFLLSRAHTLRAPPPSFSPPEIWPIRSIDTMKTSRDNARAMLHTPSYDAAIKTQLLAIKQTGANYVAIDTPYDGEFLPYLNRWVSLARQAGLHVWFRGNWSNWEGWFGYPKNMTPSEHVQKNANFIITHPYLFQNGDIFDPCPECENAGFWPQPKKNTAYLSFLANQEQSTKQSFEKIGKHVYPYIDSVIGGRAKDMFDQKIVDSLDHTVTIDHYFSNPQSITGYVRYFARSFNAQVVVSEFGAPVPDFNGNMTNKQQAGFINEVFTRLYTARSHVLGVNYYVIQGGTTALLNQDFSEKPAVRVITNFYSPMVLSGTIRDSLGEAVSNATVQIDGISQAETDLQGRYHIAVPQTSSLTLVAGKIGYTTEKTILTTTNGMESYQENATISPMQPSLWYHLRALLDIITTALRV